MTASGEQGRAPLEFWFDFASGYAYFAALEIEALAERHGRTVLWRPFTLGAAFKVTGAQGLSRTPLKREDARAAARFAKNVIVKYFQDGLDTDNPQAIASLGATLGINHDLILAGIPDPEVKAIARHHSEDAISRGVFGSPWIFVDGEPFWGSDRFSMVERWLAEGPW